MGKIIDHINKQGKRFIENQKVFFVATVPKQGKINLSPKGLDSFRVLEEKKVAWLNLTGSGNETSAHLAEDPRMTIMFCSFEGAPNIMRIYGQAIAYHPKDDEFQGLKHHFPENEANRQIIVLDVEGVQNSCGYGVPILKYERERDQLDDWAERKGGPEGVQAYWKEKNTMSIDGKPIEI